jgi:hypothetical protein
MTAAANQTAIDCHQVPGFHSVAGLKVARM